MKKHLIGLLLFILIVGTAVALFSALSRIPAIPEIDEVKAPTFESFLLNWRYDKAEVKISQASFNVENHKLDLSFYIKRPDKSNESIVVLLWFYTQDGKKVEYLSWEEVGIRPDFNAAEVAEHSNAFSFERLKELKPNENLYVVPQVLPAGGGHRFIPKFDKIKAVAVLKIRTK